MPIMIFLVSINLSFVSMPIGVFCTGKI
jgi:hypothetical protein